MENELKEKAERILSLPDNSIFLIYGGMTKQIARKILSEIKARNTHKLDHFDRYEDYSLGS